MYTQLTRLSLFWQNWVWLVRLGVWQLDETSLASHTLHREEGFGHAATIELLPWKLPVTNEICALRRLHPLSWSSNYITMCSADVSILSSNRAV